VFVAGKQAQALQGLALRAAVRADVPGINALIRTSALGLCTATYQLQQVEAALRGAFGVDTQLIDDGTYFVVEDSADGEGAPGNRAVLAGCGGWSYRSTLFGGDARPERDPAQLDPARDAARIRAFFVHPGYARLGIASLLLEHCEVQARARGFTRLSLMGTLSGVPFYKARGYLPEAQVVYPMGEGLGIEFVPMNKVLEG
jgi:GNAT superfamily N-acetyltransferase